MTIRNWPAKIAALYRRSPTFLLAAWFFGLALAGTILLALPASQRADGPGLGPLGSLFTAVSAFCVTGLVLVDTQETFTHFGQAVLLVLMELGGVGVMTFAALAFSMFGRRMSLIGRAALTDTLFQNDAAREFAQLFRTMLKAVIGIQAGGFAVLYASLLLHPVEAGPDVPGPLWSAAFHSVSAFCNAGFSIYRDNLIQVADNPFFLTGVALLVILGGLGFGVLAELYHFPGRMLLRGGKVEFRRVSLNTRVVIVTTALLLLAGGALLPAINALYGDASSGPGDALFHSVVARTAGFNTSSLESVPLPGCLVLCILMFVGGSPGSCAGGVKTTSLALWIARVAASLRQDTHVNIMGYSIPDELAGRARLILALSALWVVVGVVVLSLSQPGVGLDVLLFEQISALTTTGLSMGYTPFLNRFSQIWIIASMILGKFGPLTIALWIVKPASGRIGRPEGRLMIG